MAKTYLITTHQAPERLGLPAKYHLDRGDDCINCALCAEWCQYDVHFRDAMDPRVMAEPDHKNCVGCWNCIQVCPKQELTLTLHPEHRNLGRGIFPPDMVRDAMKEAVEGKLPISGQGYGGPFSGEGWDGIWFDMSEIVRPTRDGIHGREFISTSVKLGRKNPDLTKSRFDERGGLTSPIPPLLEIALPILFDATSLGDISPAVRLAMARAATTLGTFAAATPAHIDSAMAPFANHMYLRLDGDPDEVDGLLDRALLVEIPDGPNVKDTFDRLKSRYKKVLVSVRVGPEPTEATLEDRILALARDGVGILHLATGLDGQTPDGPVWDILPAIHDRLVNTGLRDQVTLLVSGGIGSAGHVAKAIILGANAVVLDAPLAFALECGFCETCERGNCALTDKDLKPGWGEQRIINLIASWRNQLLEVLGAMGMRDINRLRGERGRAIFAVDLIEEAFGSIERIDPNQKPTVERSGNGNGHFNPESVIWQGIPSHLPGALSEWLVVRNDSCLGCGLCIEACPFGVHRRPPGTARMEKPISNLCIGSECADTDASCVAVCPENALEVKPHPHCENLGDMRWTPELLLDTFALAEGALVPPAQPWGGRGKSGGGFDRLVFHTVPSDVSPNDVDLSVSLNRQGEGADIRIPVPFYGAAMSYGSISLSLMVARLMAAKETGTFCSTGEGGYPDELIPYANHTITQVATGLFGVREETIRRSRIVELKYAQGAKPGLGGHLLGSKNTPEVARIRETVPNTSLFSPFPFHSVYSIEDHKKHIDWIKSIHPNAIVSVKVAAPNDIDMVAVGIYYAGAHIINIDGGYGGTGAAPDIAKKSIAMPIELAIPKAHTFLEKEGIRDEVVLAASGGIRTPQDALKAIALGADMVIIGTAELAAVECVRCNNCEHGRGCPRGIATSDSELGTIFESEWAARRITRIHKAWAHQMRELLARMGLTSIGALRGRTDLLRYLSEDYVPSVPRWHRAEGDQREREPFPWLSQVGRMV